MIHKYAEIFCWKNVSSFCSAKATHILSAKNIRILYTESAKTVNEMTLNELVKLTTLWTTGPRSDILYGIKIYPLHFYEIHMQASIRSGTIAIDIVRNSRDVSHILLHSIKKCKITWLESTFIELRNALTSIILMCVWRQLLRQKHLRVI